ncbi:MAG TPA: glycosyltransferase [Acidobacteriota bacterium]|nr:glycosyltransferase [Acidobacteriota bacterium]
MTPAPRVAFFTDCFNEVNGVALTARQLFQHARRHQLPLLCVHGDRDNGLERQGDCWELRLKRGPWTSVSLERDFQIDLVSFRHALKVRRTLRDFRPDLIHVTSTGDIAGLGFAAAALGGHPLLASWHTQVHEFARRRLERMLGWLPERTRRGLGRAVEALVRQAVLWPYRSARLVLAPTRELAIQLESWTGRPGGVLGRGVDNRAFSPCWRTRPESDTALRLGFVGRISAEKGLELLPRVEEALLRAGVRDFTTVLIGEGGDRPRLMRELRHGHWTGVLRGEALSRAISDLDLLVFPSKTDTFGNAVQEALSSGVPAVVTDQGGPKHIVRHSHSGCITHSDHDFIQAVVALAQDRPRLSRMSQAARLQSLGRTWGSAFDDLWVHYTQVADSHEVCPQPENPPPEPIHPAAQPQR